MSCAGPPASALMVVAPMQSASRCAPPDDRKGRRLRFLRVNQMRCIKCGSENREGAKFCNECATPFAAKCPQCGATNPPGAKFCDECSGSLTSPPIVHQAAPAVRVVAEQDDAAVI